MIRTWFHCGVVVFGGALSLSIAAGTAGSGKPFETLPVGPERRLAIAGFTGAISLRAGTDGQIRFARVASAPPAAKLPVQVSRADGVVALFPGEGGADGAGSIEVVVPPEFAVEVRAHDAKIKASSLRAGLDVHGERVELDLRKIGGSLRLDLTAGKFLVDGTSGDAHLRLRGAAGRLARTAGSASVDAREGSVEIGTLSGALDAALDGASLVAAGIGGPVTVRASGGKVDLRDAPQGGTFRLTGAPLALTGVGGEVGVETDAAVSFRDLTGDLNVVGVGVAVRGSRSTGRVEIETSDAEVALDRIEGAVRIRGRRLTAKLGQLAGALAVEADYSRVAIADPKGTVTFDGNGTTLSVHNAADAVTIRGAGVETEVVGQIGALALETSAERVAVSWVPNAPTRDSQVTNEGGSVQMSFAPGADVRLAVESRMGRIDSRIAGHRAGDGERSVEWDLGAQGSGATVRILADGDIVLTESAPR